MLQLESAPATEVNDDFESVFAPFRKDLVDFAVFKLNQNIFRAKELAEDVLIYAWLHRDRYPHLKAALFMILRCRVIDSGRRNSRNKGDELLQYEYVTDDANPVDVDEACQVVREAIGDLSPKLRGVAECVFLEELTSDEAAAALHIPSNTVRTRVWRAKEKLRQKLHAYYSL